MTVLPTATRLYVTYQLGGPTRDPLLRPRRQAAPGPEAARVGAVGGLTPAGGDDVIFAAGLVHRAAGQYLLPGRRRSETTKLPLTVAAGRRFRRRRGRPRVRHEQGRDEGAGEHPHPEGGEARRLEPVPGDRLRRVRRQHRAGVQSRRGACCSTTGSWSRWPTCAAAASSARSGTRPASLTKKQNVFDDFAAVLKHLIDRKYTSPAKLAIEGGSNGGLLMGATLTQHPDLMKCVVVARRHLRHAAGELSPNGAFNIPEFGTVKDAEQFKALHAYSPYHRVKDGTKYPAVLFLTGANDPRVDPMQSRKMTARLQAANPDGIVLLRTSASSGHGLGTALSEQIEEETDVFAFLFAQLGVRVKL